MGIDPLNVGVLGPLEVSLGDRQVLIPSARQRALIALLALNAGHVVSTGRLVDGLWAEIPPGAGLNALRHHVSRLRKAIGSTLVTRTTGYCLDLEQVAADAPAARGADADA